ncbi:MAG: MNIO family bufferin maturase [Alphaproteobacteria bacterium]
MTQTPHPERPYLGFGLGLRKVDWFEIISENYMASGGRPLANLMRVRAEYPVVMHGVSLSIGSIDPFDEDYLNGLKALADRVEPEWVSDHLCWTGVDGVNLHDLLPLPYTEEALAHVVDRIGQVQDRLGRRIVLENASTYVTFKGSEMTEWEFLAEMAKRADCNLLLDVNNIYVSGFNHDFDPMDFMRGLPAERIVQIHLAGHEHNETHIIDTHDASVTDAVWDLYGQVIGELGPITTMIERDADIPPFAELETELDHARQVAGAGGAIAP